MHLLCHATTTKGYFPLKYWNIITLRVSFEPKKVTISKEIAQSSPCFARWSIANMLPEKFLLTSMLLILIWFGLLLVLFIYSIWAPSSLNFPISKELPIQYEDDAFSKKKYNFQIIRLFLVDEKYLLLKIQLIYLMGGWVTLMDNALSNYPRQCAHCWHTLPILY